MPETKEGCSHPKSLYQVQGLPGHPVTPAQSKALALCQQETRSQHNDLAVKIMKVNQGGREGRWPLAELSLPDCTYDSTHCSAFCSQGAPGGGGSSMQAIRLVHLVQVEELQTPAKKNIQTSSLK